MSMSAASASASYRISLSFSLSPSLSPSPSPSPSSLTLSLSHMKRHFFSSSLSFSSSSSVHSSPFKVILAFHPNGKSLNSLHNKNPHHLYNSFGNINFPCGNSFYPSPSSLSLSSNHWRREFSANTQEASTASASSSSSSSTSFSYSEKTNHSDTNKDGHENHQNHKDSSSSSSSSSSSFFPQWFWSLLSGPIYLFNIYNKYLSSHPYTVQMLTSGILFAAGDLTAQRYEYNLEMEKILQKSKDPPHQHHLLTVEAILGSDTIPMPHDTQAVLGDSSSSLPSFSFRRLIACSSFGLFIMGPGGHVWYSWLDRFMMKYSVPRSMKNCIGKVLIDTAIFNPIFLVVFFSSVSLIEGMSLKEISNKLYRDFVPSYAVDCSVWPFLQLLNFRFIRVEHQLLFVNLFCYFDDIFLSYCAYNGLPQIFSPVNEWWKRFMAKQEKKEQIKEEKHTLDVTMGKLKILTKETELQRERESQMGNGIKGEQR